MTDKPTVREKAFYILGMVNGFKAVGWPMHIRLSARKHWLECGRHAARMATGQEITPEQSAAVVALFDSEPPIEGASNAI